MALWYYFSGTTRWTRSARDLARWAQGVHSAYAPTHHAPHKHVLKTCAAELGVAASSPVKDESPSGDAAVDPEERVKPWQQRQILIFVISSGQTNHATSPGRPFAPAMLKLFGLMDCTVVVIGKAGATVADQLVGLIMFTINGIW